MEAPLEGAFSYANVADDEVYSLPVGGVRSPGAGVVR